jgi:hypothetical protein
MAGRASVPVPIAQTPTKLGKRRKRTPKPKTAPRDQAPDSPTTNTATVPAASTVDPIQDSAMTNEGSESGSNGSSHTQGDQNIPSMEARPIVDSSDEENESTEYQDNQMLVSADGTELTYEGAQHSMEEEFDEEIAEPARLENLFGQDDQSATQASNDSDMEEEEEEEILSNKSHPPLSQGLTGKMENMELQPKETDQTPGPHSA